MKMFNSKNLEQGVNKNVTSEENSNDNSKILSSNIFIEGMDQVFNM